MTTRTVIYARYSSELQRDSSIEDQVRICRARADREGWIISEIFADHARSATTTLRPGYQALLAYLRRPGADIVLVESLDRLSRDQEHIAAFFKQASFAGASIHTLAEGEISELHVGLKGTMGALYLKDLAAKTRRGLEGRIRKGRCLGTAPYGYRVIHRLGQDGEPERGLREIDQAQAAVVRRIFADYAAGTSPRSIARALNAAGIQSPGGKFWYDSVIRGNASRGDGLLRNAIYVGRLVWNRRRNSKDPVNGTRVRRTNPAPDVVVHEIPELAIVDITTWQRVQDRLSAEAAPRDDIPLSSGRFWERRRPRLLLSGKVVCGVCGRTFCRVGKDYLACRANLDSGCYNTVRLRLVHLEARVLDALSCKLVNPDLVSIFIEEFTRTWKQTLAQAIGQTDDHRRELQVVEKRIHNLIDALADGLRAPDIQQRLGELERRRAELGKALTASAAVIPVIPANLAAIYRDKLANLRLALAGPDNTEAREAARALIARIVVTPPTDPDEPPDIELVGDLSKMLTTGGLRAHSPGEATWTNQVLSMFESSVKGGPGAWPLAGLGGAQPSLPLNSTRS